MTPNLSKINTRQAIWRILKARLANTRIKYKTELEAYDGDGTDLAVKLFMWDDRTTTDLHLHITPRIYIEYYEDISYVQFNVIERKIERYLSDHMLILNFDMSSNFNSRYKYPTIQAA